MLGLNQEEAHLCIFPGKAPCVQPQNNLAREEIQISFSGVFKIEVSIFQ